MPVYKTPELIDAPLDWAVAKCEEVEPEWLIEDNFSHARAYGEFTYSSNWAKGGPILSRERIDRVFNHKSGLWLAFTSRGTTHTHQDKSELVAGLRCVVASKLGDEVEIPEELL